MATELSSVPDMTASLEPLPRIDAYEQWQQSEGVATVSGFYIEDLNALELGPWKRKGGRGAIVSRLRSKTERWICCAISGLGPREKPRPRNQHMTNTANADSAAPATESVDVWTPVRRMLRRIGSPTAKPMLEPRLPPITSTSTAPSGRELELLISR